MAEQHAIDVVIHPGIALGGGGRLELDAVNALTGAGVEVDRGRLRRQRIERIDDLVALLRLAPVAEQRAGLVEHGGTVLAAGRLVGHHGVAGVVDPQPHAVVVDLLFVADQRAGADAGAGKRGDQRNIHLVARIGQFATDADDGTHVLAHVRREQVLADVFEVDLLGELNEDVISLWGRNGHGGRPFLQTAGL